MTRLTLDQLDTLKARNPVHEVAGAARVNGIGGGAPTRPVLRWHGGKWKLAPWIIGHFPPHRVYVEPFGGAASVLLRKERCYAEVYNDLDKVVVNLFSVLRDEAKASRLVELIWHTPFARDEFDAALNAPDSDVERARALIVRSFMGFGSNSHAAPPRDSDRSAGGGAIPIAQPDSGRTATEAAPRLRTIGRAIPPRWPRLSSGLGVS